MEMTRREFMRAIAGTASAACVSCGEGVSPLRVAGILPALRGPGTPNAISSRLGAHDALATKDKGGRPSPHCLGTYPGKVVPLGDINRQSKWSG